MDVWQCKGNQWRKNNGMHVHGTRLCAVPWRHREHPAFYDVRRRDRGAKFGHDLRRSADVEPAVIYRRYFAFRQRPEHRSRHLFYVTPFPSFYATARLLLSEYRDRYVFGVYA